MGWIAGEPNLPTPFIVKGLAKRFVDTGINSNTRHEQRCYPIDLHWLVHDFDERHCTSPKHAVDHESTSIDLGDLHRVFATAFLLEIPDVAVPGIVEGPPRSFEVSAEEA
jgi:hypothetical protein